MDKEFILNENTKSLVFVKDTEPAQVYLNGTLVEGMSAIKDAVQGTTEVTYNSEYKKNLMNMSVEGNTTQKTTTGKNLIDPEKLAELVLSYRGTSYYADIIEFEGRRCLSFDNRIPYNKDLTACCPVFKEKTRYIFSFEARPYSIMPEDAQYEGHLGIGFKPSGTYTSKVLSAKTTTEFTRIYIVNYSNSTVTDIAITWGTEHRWLIDLDTVYLYEYEGDANPPYEEYTGRIPSPNAGQTIIKTETEYHLETLDLSNLEYVTNSVSNVLVSTTSFNTDGNDWMLTLDSMFTGDNDNKFIAVAKTQEELFSGINMLVLCKGYNTYSQNIKGEFYIGIGNELGIPTGEEDDYWRGLKEANCSVYYEKEVVVERTEIPAFPQPIENSTNVSVELRGVNLFDITSVTVTNGTTYEITDNTIVFTPKQSYSKYRYHIKVEIGKQYTISVGDVFNTETTNSALNRLPIGSIESFDNADYGFATKDKPLTITATTEDLYIDGYVCYTYNEGQIHTIVKPMVVEGSNTTEYEPYFEPTKVDIPSEVTLTDGTVVPLRFARLGTVNNVAINKADTLTVDKIANKVTYTQYLDLFRPKVPYVASLNIYPNGQYGGVGMYFKTTMLQKGMRLKGICTHGGKVGQYYSKLDIWMGANNAVVYWLGIVSNLGYNSEWADKFNPTAEEKTIAKEKMDNWFAEQEANGTPFEVLYELPTPIEYDLTNTDLGQQLLNLAKSTQNQTNTITVNSTLPISKLDVGYAIWGGRDES